jgi:hypothetical protein
MMLMITLHLVFLSTGDAALIAVTEMIITTVAARVRRLSV